MSRFIYFVMVVIIGLVSVYDNAATYTFRDTIRETEENPAGRWLIDQGGVSLFVTVKAMTTLLVVGICLRLIYSDKYKIVIVAVCIFQILLFLYLNFYEPIPGAVGENTVYEEIMEEL